jgi:hypothetical protein
LAEDNTGKTPNAFLLQLNPDIYATIIAMFCATGSAIMHVNANVCQSLVPAREMECKIHCWEQDSKIIEAGIEHAASIAAMRDLEEAKEVYFYFINCA